MIKKNKLAGYLGVYYHSEPKVSRLGEWWVRALDTPVGASQEVPTKDDDFPSIHVMICFTLVDKVICSRRFTIKDDVPLMWPLFMYEEIYHQGCFS